MLTGTGIVSALGIDVTEFHERLYWHAAVREAAVVARPDDEWGEAVHAFVALHEGETATPEELIDCCR